MKPQLSERIKDGTLPAPFRMARTAGSVDSISSAAIMSPRDNNLSTSKKVLDFSQTPPKILPLSSPSIAHKEERQQSPRIIDSPGRKPRSNTSPYPASFMNELNSKIRQQTGISL